MNIVKSMDNGTLRLAVEGRLDTTTAPALEAEIRTGLEGIASLVFDLSALEYISSAGLRVLLSAQKTMNKQGSMVVKGANESVREVFEITGFSDILTLED